MQRRVYLETMGCQMNVYDSDRMLEGLARAGYTATDRPDLADLLLVNTCSIRENVEHKVVSLLGTWRRLKDVNPDAVLGVAGCVAQQEGDRLLAKVPALDLVIGPDQIDQLPALVEAARDRHQRGSAAAFVKRKDYVFPRAEPPEDGRVTAMITVMKGCNKVCAFCIVPFTRGREVSKPSADVIAEVRMLVGAGVREVTLLGQNVNSYGLDRPGELDFPALIEAVAAIDGLQRIRFTTSHPVDCTDRLIDAFATVPKLVPFFHLPIQSGSARVLQAMRRSHGVDDYLAKIARLRQKVPAIALSTDIIVGHPGETDADFAQTLDLLATVRYATIFSFLYSARPGTRSAELPDDVPLAEKKRRLMAVQTLQNDVTRTWMAAHRGREVEVLFEGPSRLESLGPNSLLGKERAGQAPQLMGRTPENVKVNVAFDDPAALRDWPGRLGRVVIERVGAHSLGGRLVGLQ
ncbi:MAG: tRNA (N6-isopentenyl adenosine(37)-C2)-methylthiotransferase MiaB [Myxococcales bacterium]|nr:tRNA (N6-isopentenyl adenosine(37)-C2)-methylthiotransferase MiaB [Myxococcales bacterium]